MQPASRQRVSKHVQCVNAATELLLETVFSTWPVQSGYKEDNWDDPVSCQLIKS
jgi:hypothetical protein